MRAGTMICLQYLSCFCDIAACVSGNQSVRDAAQAVDCVADVMWCRRARARVFWRGF